MRVLAELFLEVAILAYRRYYSILLDIVLLACYKWSMATGTSEPPSFGLLLRSPRVSTVVVAAVVFICTLPFELLCSPYESHGGQAAGWHYPCGMLSVSTQVVYDLLDRFSEFSGPAYLLLRLAVSYIISCAAVAIIKRPSESQRVQGSSKVDEAQIG